MKIQFKILGMVNCFVRVAKEEGTIALWRGNMGTFERTLSGVTPEIKDIAEDQAP